MSVPDAASIYIGTYDGFHLLFAKHRLLGWDGEMKTAPQEVEYANDAMIRALRILRSELGLPDRVNYVDEAQKLIDAKG